MSGPVIAVLAISALIQGALAFDCNWTLQLPTHLTVQKGLCVLIQCNYTYPCALNSTQAAVIWHKNLQLSSQAIVYHTDPGQIHQDYKSRTQLAGNLTDQDCSLRIGSIRDADDGTYHFGIALGEINHTHDGTFLNLTISELEQKPNVSYTSQIIANQTVTLNCTFLDTCGGIGPNLTWINDTALNITAPVGTTQQYNSGSLFSTSLTFIPSSRDDGKLMGCRVQYQLAQAQSDQTLRLDVKYGPRIEKIPSVRAVEGDTVRIRCIVNSNPLSNITWFADHERILTAVNQTLTLQINNVTLRDGGYYYCRAWNEYDKATRKVNVTVFYRPRIEPMNHTVAVLEGQSFERICRVDSHPVSNITWYWKNQLLNRTTSNQLTLVITGMKEADIGLYTCSAVNPHGETNHSLYIRMEYQPRNLLIRTTDNATANSSVRTDEGESLSLLCSVDSIPASNLTWKTNGNVRNASFGSNELWLHVDNITYREDGEHECQARNPHGEVQESVTVTLAYSPKETRVRVRGAQLEIREGDNITLTCSSRSNPPVTNYSWFRTDGSNRTEFVSSAETINLGPVTRDDDAWFYCRAQNALGSSSSPGLFISAEYQPEISRESTCARRAEGVTCVCTARSNPPGDLTWHLPHANASGNQTQGGFVAWRVVDGHLVTGSLTLTGHQGEEDVTASCIVRNPHGEAMFKVYLWVKGESPDRIRMILCAVAGALGMLILSFILCWIIVCCRRKTKPAAVTDAEMEILTGQATPVLAASLAEAEVEEEGGEEEVGSLTEEVSEAGSLKPEENGEAAGSEAETRVQELHYACIDFSKARPCDAIVGTRDSTQYAEIKPQ